MTALLERPLLKSIPFDWENYDVEAHENVIATDVAWDDFVVASEYHGRHVEWVAGKVVEELVSVALDHSFLVTYLVRLLGMVAECLGDGTVLADQYLMRLSNLARGREPDVIYVAADHSERMLHTHLDGPGDIVVEVVSPESEERDYNVKRAEYEAGGVREYWIIDPQTQTALFYQLGANGLFQLAPTPNGVFQSQVLPVIQFQIEWLWERRPIMDVLREWNLI